MMEELQKRVAARLAAINKGPVEAATSAKLERNYIRDITEGKKKSVRADKLEQLAAALETTIEYLTARTNDPSRAGADIIARDPKSGPMALVEGKTYQHFEEPALRHFEEPPLRPLPPEPNTDLARAEDVPSFRGFGGPRSVPVYGTAVGGGNDDGDFRFNGETIDYAPRPPGIASRKDVYVLYVRNDSMAPRFEEGERLYVDPHRTPRPTDYVVVELHGSDHGDPGKGFIKRLVRKTSTKLIVSQFNPPKELEFDLQDVKSLHRVIPYDELLGV
ncbi:S24 family peptidase [Microvirga sp. M2]|uniref:S24 family peptidase n=1 Tax=Microvirga sp. M2 TaxID=3073270 RepID=UPI0039C2B819